MRRALILAVAGLAVVTLTGGAGAAANKPLLGITGQHDRFKTQTGQESVVHQAFLGWGQGQAYGSSLPKLLASLGPVPMLHLGTAAKPPSKQEAITPLAIARGKGDSYLMALNAAINQWGGLVYVRPMAEMNNPANLYSYEHSHNAAHAPAAYKLAFCRISYILHGGPAAAVSAKLKALGLPGVKNALAVNPYPGSLRVIWNPLAGIEHGPAPAQRYYPSDACVDLVGNGMFASSVGQASWAENQALYDAHPNKPYSFPEWGLEGVDDPGFVTMMCEFAKTHARVQMLAYYESKPGSRYDLQSAPDKPLSRAAYRKCLTPIGGAAPGGGGGGSGPATIAPTPKTKLSITPNPAKGAAPLQVTFALEASIGKPVVQWQVAFGDGSVKSGVGPPPATVPHTYARDGVYQATLIVYIGPPFTGTAVRFLTSTKVSVGEEPGTLLALRPNTTSGPAPLAVSFHTIVNTTKPVVQWQLLWGDGDQRTGTGKPPSFLGHTYAKKGAYRAVLIVYLSPPFTGTAVRLITYADIRVS